MDWKCLSLRYKSGIVFGLIYIINFIIDNVKIFLWQKFFIPTPTIISIISIPLSILIEFITKVPRGLLFGEVYSYSFFYNLIMFTYTILFGIVVGIILEKVLRPLYNKDVVKADKKEKYKEQKVYPEDKIKRFRVPLITGFCFFIFPIIFLFCRSSCNDMACIICLPFMLGVPIFTYLLYFITGGMLRNTFLYYLYDFEKWNLLSFYIVNFLMYFIIGFFIGWIVLRINDYFKKNK